MLGCPFKAYQTDMTEKTVMERRVIQNYLLCRSHSGILYPDNPKINLGTDSVRPIFPIANTKLTPLPPQQIKTMILKNYGAELKAMKFKKYVKISVFLVCKFYCEMW